MARVRPLTQRCLLWLLSLLRLLLFPVLITLPGPKVIVPPLISLSGTVSCTLLLPPVSPLRLPVQWPLLAALLFCCPLIFAEIQLLVVIYLAGTGGPALRQALVVLKSLQCLFLDDGRRHHNVVLPATRRRATTPVPLPKGWPRMARVVGGESSREVSSPHIRWCDSSKLVHLSPMRWGRTHTPHASPRNH